MNIRCFLLTPTELCRLDLRRYVGVSSGGECSASGMGYHNADTPIGVAKKPSESELEAPQHSDPRWPTRCACGYVFANGDVWQFRTDRLYRRSDTGHLTTLHDAPAGAMWFADWLSDCPEYLGPDGRTLVVRCPGSHDWIIDSRASNCTMLEDKVHKCWVRHGEAPDVHVDKNGLTCDAGAGSIMVPGYHGFLHHGHLTEC